VGHLKEDQDQLANVFAKFNLGDRLTRFEIASCALSSSAAFERHVRERSRRLL
jgi:hypothetical protein